MAARTLKASRPRRGMTLVEVLIVIALIAVIAALAIPAMVDALERTRVKRAIAEVAAIELEIENWHEDLPDDLSELPPRPRVDPWGREYVYFKFGGPGWRGQARKDRFLVPINSTFDLYSVGRDGDSRKPLQNPKSFDDVIRANDGAFIGLARDF
jgi:general secretion pathway protein G